ncbi:hypothetical protein [Paractinoplanes atraurantiacus]|uniref:Uncharacterized protein n=1 Tax=Paractinoplanes atraurantiacus TaxID=1036182 RepID=A0A285KBV0_9ACTN|nr:hypothetical protein [Actinoplanes atraurantiacus]SNY70094.1 hypothetical protein SAMN05421748_13714 [Actinoplanes atraurantiacus]
MFNAVVIIAEAVFEPLSAPCAWVVLNADCTDEQIGLFHTTLAALGDSTEITDAYLAEEILIINGGLRLRDTTSGHVIEPVIETVGDDLRVWPDTEKRDHHIDVPRAALPQLLAGIQRDLIGFLEAFAAWAPRHGLGDRAEALVSALDDGFAISAPLQRI